MDNSTGPVFLLAGGGRTGSTLVQRLILSTRQVMMWGEHGGVLIPQLRALVKQIDAWNKSEGGCDMLTEYRKTPDNSWVANMNPEATFFMTACQAFLYQSLGVPAQKMGYSRWGFKEIRYGATEALALQKLFPYASFIFLVRNPANCLRSIKATEWYAKDHSAEPTIFLDKWARFSGELAEVQPRLQRACLVRYEDLISDPDSTINTIAHTIGIPASAFNRSILNKVLRGSDSAPAMLEPRDIAALQQPQIQSVAGKFDYLSLT